MYELVVRRPFDASHVVEGHPGKCARLHGHRWVAEAVVRAARLDGIGMAVDFGLLKDALEEILPDHRHLNDLLPEGYNATAERTAQWLYETLVPRLHGTGAKLVRVNVWETPDCAAAYLPEEQDAEARGSEA